MSLSTSSSNSPPVTSRLSHCSLGANDIIATARGSLRAGRSEAAFYAGRVLDVCPLPGQIDANLRNPVVTGTLAPVGPATKTVSLASSVIVSGRADSHAAQTDHDLGRGSFSDAEDGDESDGEIELHCGEVNSFAGWKKVLGLSWCPLLREEVSDETTEKSVEDALFYIR
jgi:hypothetical protein